MNKNDIDYVEVLGKNQHKINAVFNLIWRDKSSVSKFDILCSSGTTNSSYYFVSLMEQKLNDFRLGSFS